MSLFAAQSGLETNYEFRQRVRACVVQETGAWTEDASATTDEIVDQIMPDVAASPGFAAQYLWGDQAAGIVPGHNAIEDNEILATVQPLLEQFRTTPA
jgi:hypothetical protein